MPTVRISNSLAILAMTGAAPLDGRELPGRAHGAVEREIAHGSDPQLVTKLGAELVVKVLILPAVARDAAQVHVVDIGRALESGALEGGALESGGSRAAGAHWRRRHRAV